MQLFQDLCNRFKQLNRAPKIKPLAYHAQQGRYKLIHQAIKIPNLPAPLHYLNFYSLLGQPKASIFEQPHLQIKEKSNVATVLTSISPHMLGHYHAYDIQHDCQFTAHSFYFEQREALIGVLHSFHLIRYDTELSIDLKIYTYDLASYFCQLRWSLGEYWSLPCRCVGLVTYQGQQYSIDQLGVFEYARAIDFIYLPIAFWVYQLIPLTNEQQLICMQLRDQFNSVLYSRLYLKNIKEQTIEVYDHQVHFYIQRVYPKVQTPNAQSMYLPREFLWSYQDDKTHIHIEGCSRGDFKFGLAAGYVGSFNYQVYIDQHVYHGEHAYCEYVDCRSLKWQELSNLEKNTNKFEHLLPVMVKK